MFETNGLKELYFQGNTNAFNTRGQAVVKLLSTCTRRPHLVAEDVQLRSGPVSRASGEVELHVLAKARHRDGAVRIPRQRLQQEMR